MKIIFAGTPINAAVTLRELVAHGHDVVAVLTREDSIVGRKKELKQSVVADVADELNIEVIKANRVDEAVFKRIHATAAELGVVVAYGTILQPNALESLKLGWINLHYSLLPNWRGAAPAQRAILNGDQLTGVTLFQLDAGLDTGPIWGQLQTEIQPAETGGELIDRLTALGVTLLDEQLPRIESAIFSPVPQQVSGNELIAKKLDRSEAQINFNNSAVQVERAIRAFNPEPVAFTLCNGEAFRILQARALGATDWSALSDKTHTPGELVFDAKRVLVQCGQGTLLELKQVQPAGKKPMAALEWSRGTKVTQLG